MIRSLPSWETLDAMTATDAAAFWLVRLDSEPTAGDRTLFEQWLCRSEDNALAWHAVQRSWTAFEVDPIFAQDAMQSMGREARALLEHRHHRDRWPTFAKMAAGLLVCATAAGLIAQGGFWRAADGNGATMATRETTRDFRYATRVGEMSTVSLPDGTRVVLDTNTMIEGSVSAHAREIRLLAGQAYFDVRHDARRPLRIDAAGQIVTDLGTRFNVSTESNILRVTLEQGQVAIEPADRKTAGVTLRPGEELTADRHGYRVTRVDTGLRGQWRLGLATFHNAPLSAVIAEFNRYGARIVIHDQAVSNLRISGVFKTADPGTFLVNLTELYSVKVLDREGGYKEIKNIT